MSGTILAVRADELVQQIGLRPFLALPREEIDRHFATVELLELDRAQAAGDAGYRELSTFAIAHYNYSWMSHAGAGADARSLGVVGEIEADGRDHLFLDDYPERAVRHSLDAALRFPDGYELRLSGLLNHDAGGESPGRLALVYVARLRRAGAEAGAQEIADVRFHGMGELPEQREQFDLWSQILIDNLQSF